MDKVEMPANYFGILKSDPIEGKAADHAFEVSADEDSIEILDLLKQMDADTQKIAKGLLRSLIESKKEA